MEMNIKVDTSQVRAMASKFPRATAIASDNFVDKAGYLLERNAKQKTPTVPTNNSYKITGNLSRSIFYVKGDAKVVAHANYAKYVHGAPYYNNLIKRRETPFFTYALVDSASAIKGFARDIMGDIAKNIGN